MRGRYNYYQESTYKDTSVQGEYAPLTNPASLVSALPGVYFKNTDFYPDILNFNYTDIEFKVEPQKLTIDEVTLNLFYMVPYTLYVNNKNRVDTSVQIAEVSSVTYDKEDILLDINNIPHKDVLYALDDDGTEYIIVPQSSDWLLLLNYMENQRRRV